MNEHDRIKTWKKGFSWILMDFPYVDMLQGSYA